MVSAAAAAQKDSRKASREALENFSGIHPEMEEGRDSCSILIAGAITPAQYLVSVGVAARTSRLIV